MEEEAVPPTEILQESSLVWVEVNLCDVWAT